jgi:hypothetical protein
MRDHETMRVTRDHEITRPTRPARDALPIAQGTRNPADEERLSCGCFLRVGSRGVESRPPLPSRKPERERFPLGVERTPLRRGPLSARYFFWPSSSQRDEPDRLRPRQLKGAEEGRGPLSGEDPSPLERSAEDPSPLERRGERCFTREEERGPLSAAPHGAA